MTTVFPPRRRKVRVLATLGPASHSAETIRALHEVGADAFRINMSHGEHATHAETVRRIRALEAEVGRPMTIVVDLQGPKLRVGQFEGGRVTLTAGDRFVLDRESAPGTAARVCLPHDPIYAAAGVGSRLLLDDGKLVLRVVAANADRIVTEVVVGGVLSDRKGLNVPDAVLDLSPLSPKDLRDLDWALDNGTDWIALSFVQRPEDVAEARKRIAGRAALLSKIEKPAALDRLPEIVELSDAVMVARGDLGVELPPQDVPPAQKRIVEQARRLGKPVVVATQMLESMIASPTPTRAEVSDVATAIYDGADAVMLSAESAAGAYPTEAVRMMNAIALATEADPAYAARVHFTVTPPEPTTADALAEAANNIVRTVGATVIVCFTMSGSTARRITRERPAVPVLVLTPKRSTARRMGLLWGAHAVQTRDVGSFEEMVAKAKRMVLRHDMAGAGDRLVLVAGVPFGVPGSTNVIHVVRLTGAELAEYGEG